MKTFTNLIFFQTLLRIQKRRVVVIAETSALFFCICLSLSSPAEALTPPTFIQEAETTWNPQSLSGTDTKSVTFSVQTGDVLVAYVACEDQSSCSGSLTVSGGFSWNQEQMVSVASYTLAGIWTTTATSSGSVTITVTRGDAGANAAFGMDVLTFRNSNGIGASSKTNVASGAPSLGLTTQADNSTVVVVNDDWTSQNGSSRTWLTVNGSTPTSGNGLETTYDRNASWHTVYGAYYNDAGTAGSVTVGLSAPGSQKYSIAAVEVKGSSSASSDATHPNNVLRGDSIIRGDSRIQ